MFPSDFLVVNGHKMLPPKYYGSLFELDNPAGYDKIKKRRVARASRLVDGKDDNDIFRLAVKEEVKKAQIKNLKRGLDK